jgi:AAHS family 4-hydroxybenzoate transporter-like MFS transporter
MATSFDISEFIDSRSVGKYQLKILVTCLIAALLDGFDMQIAGLAIPVLAIDWHLTPKDFSSVLMAGPIGMVLGSAIMGPLADRFGRKRPIIVAIACFGLFTVLGAYAHSVDALAFLRLLAGLGLGGVLPNLVALTTEYAPARARATLTTLTFCGVPLGALLSGLVGTWLIPIYGWQSVFYVGGLVPLAIAVYAFFRLPESIRFIAFCVGRSEEVAAVIQKIAPDVQLPASVQFTVHEAPRKKAAVTSLFGPGRTLPTVLLTLVFMFNTFGVYFFMSWLPVLMKLAGLSLQGAILSTVLLNGGGAVGAATLGRLIDRFGGYKVMAGNYVLGAIAVLALGAADQGAVVLIPALFVTGTCVMGSQIAMYAIAAAVYPTAIRATGVGTTIGIGRSGSIIGPMAGAAAVALGWSIPAIFAMASVPIFLASFSINLVGRVPKNFGVTNGK